MTEMNLLYGTVAEVFEEDGLRMARVRVGGAKKAVPLDLVPDAGVGDVVLICNGVAIEKVKEAMAHVPGDSR